MPSYPWLETDVVDTSLLKAKLDVLSKLGVPYDKKTLDNPLISFNRQSKKITDRLLKDGVVVTSDSEIVAMIAYLQKLGTDWRKKDEGSN